MPSRIIRESLLDSERFGNATHDAQFLFMQLLILADDYGLVPVGSFFLKKRTTAVSGLVDEQIAALLLNLADQDLIRLYTSPTIGQRFAYIPRFGNWPRALKPKWPLPPEPHLSEIKGLMEKRSADALRVHSKRTASSHETETETETETEKKKKKKGRSRARSSVIASPFPADFQLTEPMFSSGLKLGLTREEIARAFIRFCDNAQAKGHEYKDWPAAFRTWCGYDAERKRKDDPPLDLTEGGRYIVE